MTAPIDISDDPISTLKASGNDHLKGGRIAEACDAYSAALDKDPGHAHADAAALLTNRALAHLKLSEPAKAEADCTAALKLQPGYGKAYYRRALAHEMAGKFSDGFKDARQLMQLEPKNKEAVQLAGKLKRAMEERAQVSDLSTPTQAVATIKTAVAGSDDQLQAVGKLSKIAEGGDRSAELLHSGAVEALVALLPAASSLGAAADLTMPLVGLCVETLDRMSGPEDKALTAVLKALNKEGGTLDKVLQIAKVAAEASKELGDGAGAETGAGTVGAAGGERVKNLLITARKALSLLASAASCRSALGSQAAQGQLVVGLLPFLRHQDETIRRAGADALVRVVDKDAEAAGSVLPQVLKQLIWLLGDEESPEHKVALGVLSILMAKKGGSDDGKVEGENTKALQAVCEQVLSPILRSDGAEWDEHVAAVHGVTAVLEVNKEVGAWLLRQESIFWSLAEVAEMDDEDLQKSLAEVYAHAANDPQHFREKAGDEPIKNLKTMLNSPKPRVRCRACVALAKTALLHQNHRVTIHPTGKLLKATLGLLEAKLPPSVHRWAVEAFMYLTVLPDTKRHLVETDVSFGSMVALSESLATEPTLAFSMLSAFRRLCVAREKSEDQQRLEQEMDKAQIEQMRQLSAGGMGAAPTEKEDDPAVLIKLAYRLVQDDAVLVIAEAVSTAKADHIKRPAAEVLLQMACTPEARGKMVQQGGFKALLSLTLSDDAKTAEAAAWGLAKVGISINPALYPRRTGSGPEAMVLPVLKLVDDLKHELMTFEACMCLCNLATVEELRDRIVKDKGWRSLEMALTSSNELVQRAAVETMSNLVAHDDIADKFTDPSATATKVFVGFCSSDDVKTQIAASGGIATLSGVPEIAASFLQANVLEPLVEIALIGEEAGCVHRAAVALQRLLMAATEEMVGKKGAATLPEHAMLALGALSHLASTCRIAPANKAAKDALAFLEAERPDVRPPPPELVAEAIKRLQEEHDRREREREAAEAEAAADEAAAKAEEEARKAKAEEKAKAAKAMAAGAGGGAGEAGSMAPVVEELGDDDDDDDDDGDVI